MLETPARRGPVRPRGTGGCGDWTAGRDPLWLALILGVASSAAWDAIKRLLGGRGNGGRVKVVVGFQQGDQIRWVQAEGGGPAVAAALDQVNPRR